MKKIQYGVYRAIRWLVEQLYPKMQVVGLENLPEEPCLIVGNHAQMHGPIAGELYFPGQHFVWCAGEMMHWREVPAYAYRDFWSRKPRGIRWFYKLLSYVITPLSVCVFNHAHTIPVYRDRRVFDTFRQTIEKLETGAHVLVFPEHDEPHDHILCDFQTGFIQVARSYYQQTGRELAFVPLYLAPSLKTMYLDEPIRFRAETSIREERRRICDELMVAIREMACALPRHRVVPYNNIPKKKYPFNTPLKAGGDRNQGEKTI